MNKNYKTALFTNGVLVKHSIDVPYSLIESLIGGVEEGTDSAVFSDKIREKLSNSYLLIKEVSDSLGTNFYVSRNK